MKRVDEASYEVAVIHGRFQVLHNDHLRYLLAGRSMCRHLVIGVTNPEPELTGEDESDPDRSKPENNPLTYFERYSLVRAALVEAGVEASAFSIVPFPINHPERYRFYVPMDAVFLLTIYDEWGRKKKRVFEQTGISTHVLWERPVAEKGLCANQVRARMAEGLPWEHLVPCSVATLLERWDITGRLTSPKTCKD